MPDNDTLLAYLVSSFPGNTENIATEALCHIFDHSDACGVALNDVIQAGVRGLNAITSVRTQVIHADGTRPDLVGFDETGMERVLIEVKFGLNSRLVSPMATLDGSRMTDRRSWCFWYRRRGSSHFGLSSRSGCVRSSAL